MTKETDFIADLRYYTAEQGGRSTPAFSGYRPHIKFPFSDMMTSGRQIFSGTKQVLPGERVVAEIAIISTAFFSGKLEIGLEFVFGEGPHVIGIGRIIEIINQDLLKK